MKIANDAHGRDTILSKRAAHKIQQFVSAPYGGKLDVSYS